MTSLHRFFCRTDFEEQKMKKGEEMSLIPETRGDEKEKKNHGLQILKCIH